MSRPTVKVEIAFAAYDPAQTTNFVLDFDVLDGASLLAVGEQYADVSAFVRDVAIRRGRQRPLDRFSAGTATVLLSNADARFDPKNLASPYANVVSGVVPGRPIRISATYNGIEYRLFTGFVDSFSYSYAPGLKDATVSLACSDGMKMLSQADGATPQIVAETNATAAATSVVVTNDQSNTSTNGYTLVTTTSGRSRLLTIG